MDTIENRSIQDEQNVADELNRKQQEELDNLEDPNSPKSYNKYPIWIFKKTFIFLILGLFLYAVRYYSEGDIMETIITWVILDLYILLFYGIYLWWKKLRKKEHLDFEQWIYYIWYRLACFMVLFVSIFSAFCYYQLKISPLTMPLYTITNGVKTVQFQSMIHIGSQRYYDKVFDTMMWYLKNGYILYYEGVRWIENKESSQKFDTIMKFNFSHDLYDNMSKIYGLVMQDNSRYINAAGQNAMNADVDLSYVIKKYEEKYGEIQVKKNGEGVVDISGLLAKRLKTLNDRQLSLLRIINKSMISFMLKNPYTSNMIVKWFGMEDVIDVILQERNKVIADTISNSKDTKIYIMYGKWHFEWVLALLQQKDSNWKIVWKRDFYPLK